MKMWRRKEKGKRKERQERKNEVRKNGWKI
jgi:hypothetical protein